MLRARTALIAVRRLVPFAAGLLQVAMFTLDRQVRSGEIRSTHVADGSGTVAHLGREESFAKRAQAGMC